MSDVGVEIGRRLREARGQMSQEDLAEAANLSVGVIRRIEQGRSARLDLRTHKALADALGVSTNWFQSVGPKFSVRRAQPDDMEQIEANEVAAYGDEALPPGMLQSWLAAYPDGGWYLFADGYPIGGVGIWPTTEQWTEGFRAGALTENDLTVAVMAAALSQPEGPTNFYLGGMIVTEQYQGGIAASYLMRRAMALWAVTVQAHQREVTAMAISDVGERLLLATGFRLVRTRESTRHAHPIYAATLTTERLLEIASEL